MQKKKIFIGFNIVFLLAVAAVFFLMRFHSTVAGTMLSKAEETALRQEKSCVQELGYHLLFKGYEVPYDSEEQVFYLPQTEKDVKQWQGVFYTEEDMKICWCEDEAWQDMEGAIAEGHRFRFLIVSGEEYTEGQMIFTGMPMMVINQIEESRDTEANCQITVFDPLHGKNGEYEITQSYAFYEVRGQTSLRFPKQGFNIELYTDKGSRNARSLLGLRKDDDWKLNALYTDASKIREKLAMDLWNEVSALNSVKYDTGTNMEYLEVLVNGGYRGLYGLMEPVDFRQTGLDKGKDVLFKAVSFITEENSVSGGFDGRGDFSGQKIKTGRQLVTEKLWQPMLDYLSVTHEEDFCAEDFLSYAETHMNLQNLIDFELYLQAIRAEDNAYKNQYHAVVMDRSGDGYTMWVLPWDLNYTFGDSFDGESDTLTAYHMDYADRLMNKYMLTNHLLDSGDEKFAETLNERWTMLREEILTAAHARELGTAYMDMLKSSGAFARDTVRWPEGEHDDSLAPILEFYQAHLEFLDEHYSSYLNNQ